MVEQSGRYPASQGRSAAPSGLSRCASQAEPAATNALMVPSLYHALAVFDGARDAWHDAITEAHANCRHEQWCEKATAPVISWGSPLSASRICLGCRAEINDRSIYNDWYLHGKHSFRKPKGVLAVFEPGQLGVATLYMLRLDNDPRPQFASFSDVLKWPASAMSAHRAETAQQAQGQRPASAVGEAETPSLHPKDHNHG